MGVASLVLGIVSIVIALVPLCGAWAVLPALIGLGLGIGELVTRSARREPRALGIAGLVLNPLAILIVLGWFLAFGAGLQELSQTGPVVPPGTATRPAAAPATVPDPPPAPPALTPMKPVTPTPVAPVDPTVPPAPLP